MHGIRRECHAKKKGLKKMTKIYVSVSHHRYYYHPEDSPWEYEIEAEPEVLTVLDQLFEQKEEIEMERVLASTYTLYTVSFRSRK